ncbi:O-antigen ligase family protein [Nocardioides sp.]|uniref:O-antigen ligase family protein n=1 Tax=Nocardioides sp. TaxID=35761 RepID=UPI002608ECCD|nr:O-antigen ligase family protein [Nocardioides sp.]
MITAVFFWMSNPLVYVPGFHLSLEKSVLWTGVALVITLPWARLPRVPLPWIVFHAATYLSLAWTIDPHLTDYTSLLYVKLTLIALAIAANCEPAVVCWGMGVGGVVVVALSIHAYEEQMWGASQALIGGAEFAGVGTNENILAYTLSISLAAILAARPPRRLAFAAVWSVVVVVNGYGIYLAQSGTGFLTVLTVLLALGLVRAWPVLRTRQRSWLLAGGGILAALLTGGMLVIVGVLGKELSSFSGRAPFWRAAWDTTMDTSPLVGSGWGAVWTHPWSMVPLNEVAQDIYDRAGYSLSHGHNLFVDVLPELGLLGVALAVLMIAYAARGVTRAGLHGASTDPAAGRLAVLVLVALLVSGITEPMFTVPLGWWSLALIAALPRQRVLIAHSADHRALEHEAPPTLPREASSATTH